MAAVNSLDSTPEKIFDLILIQAIMPLDSLLYMNYITSLTSQYIGFTPKLSDF